MIPNLMISGSQIHEPPEKLISNERRMRGRRISCDRPFSHRSEHRQKKSGNASPAFNPKIVVVAVLTASGCAASECKNPHFFAGTSRVFLKKAIDGEKKYSPPVGTTKAAGTEISCTFLSIGR